MNMEFFSGLFGKEKAPKQAEETVPGIEVTEEYPTAAGIEVEELPIEEIEIVGGASDAEADEENEEATEMPSTAGYEVAEQKSEDVEDEELREAA